MKRATALFFVTALLPFAAHAQTAPPGNHAGPGAGHGAPASNIPDWLAPAPSKTPAPEQLPNAGQVASFIPTPQYAYIEVNKGNKREWLAAPAIELKVGDWISYSNGARMANFSSKAIGRSFPSIMFVDYVSPLDARLAAQAKAAVDAAAAAAAAAPAPAPAGHGADHGTAVAPKAPELPHKGTVVSILPTPQYTYIEVGKGDKTEWIAAPSVNLNVGDSIGYSEGAHMSNFSSKALGRSFPTIMFVDRVSPLETK